MAHGFDVAELDYHLPEALIAQEPVAVRGTSRMLVVDRATRRLEDRCVGDLERYLQNPDALVLNDTRVVPGKFVLRRATGGRIEGLFLREHRPGHWEVLLKGANRLKPGEVVGFEGDASHTLITVEERIEGGRWRLGTDGSVTAGALLERVGRMPLPPYIKRDKPADGRDDRDRDRYQTVYAARDGAVAAPTAGLHLTAAMLDRFRAAGVAVERVTLHVGYGTFAPIEANDLADHEMHSEHFEIDDDTCRHLTQARRAGGRVVAVGTTSARVLESACAQTGSPEARCGWTDIFCYPPYTFRGVDVLMTNFHLPRSTLLAMVMAFAGVDLTRRAYAHAIEARYRFYSYGDAMLIL